jgi:hypothetical protein
MLKVTPRLFAAVVAGRPAIPYGLQTEDLSAADHGLAQGPLTAGICSREADAAWNCFNRAELHFCSED